MNFQSAKKVKSRDENAILVNLIQYEDKEEILSKFAEKADDVNYRIENYDYDLEKTDLEKFHSKFCKYVLNVSNKSSSMAAKTELGRYPLYYKAITLTMKYWHRLEKGTKNLFVNEAYECAKSENHSWYRHVKSFQIVNGLRIFSVTPNLAHSSKHFGKIVKQNLEDQYIQTWNNKIRTSRRLGVLSLVKDDFCCSNYLNIIKKPEIRNTFVRLRTDLSILNSVAANRQTGLTLCSTCNHAEETVAHFILDCKRLLPIRTSFRQKVNELIPNFEHLDRDEKLKCIIDLDPDCRSTDQGEFVRIACHYVHKLYSERFDSTRI